MHTHTHNGRLHVVFADVLYTGDHRSGAHIWDVRVCGGRAQLDLGVTEYSMPARRWCVSGLTPSSTATAAAAAAPTPTERTAKAATGRGGGRGRSTAGTTVTTSAASTSPTTSSARARGACEPCAIKSIRAFSDGNRFATVTQRGLAPLDKFAFVCVCVFVRVFVCVCVCVCECVCVSVCECV